jgi:hypothetical protein
MMTDAVDQKRGILAKVRLTWLEQVAVDPAVMVEDSV